KKDSILGCLWGNAAVRSRLPRFGSATPKPVAEVESAWIRMRASSAVRPYSLSLNKDHYHYFPGAQHLNPRRLQKLLGSNFDPFWMAVDPPDGAGRGNESHADLVSRSPRLTEPANRYQKKLRHEAERLGLGAGGDGGKEALARWLVKVASCPLTSAWKDLGPVFWPRWVRHTDCDRAKRGCSWPMGMTCQRDRWTHINLLVWHCLAARPAVGKHCTWRQIPYPVVTGCKCSCQ
uniref:Noggin n=1 Tax=Callorhinchus milii TaxID=7868 RepID=A0A4W3H9B1_CALMI